MGTISSLLSSANSLINTPANVTGNSSSSTTTNYFAGTSSYSDQFQQVIGRAVAIASLPVELLSSQQTTLNNQSTELATLDSNFGAVQSAIQSISNALSGASMNSSVSDPAVASVTVGNGAAEGAYTIHVSSIGAYATSLSSTAWNSPSGLAGSYNLVIGDRTYSFSPAGNSAGAVASTINAQYGNLVQATAVNVGSAANPDYRISLQSASLGPLDLDIQAPAGASLQSVQPAATGNASSLTAATWNSSGDPQVYTLVVDSNTFTVNPEDNTAAGVAAAINALSGSPVQATVIDLGTAGAPDERIQLQSTAAGVSIVDLLDSSEESLQQQQPPAAPGSAVSETSSAWDASPDPSGDPTQYTLTIGDTTQTFAADDNSAAGVAAAINALDGNPVSAVVVNAGTATAPDYRIQLTDNTGSGNSPQLARNIPFSLQKQGTAGSLAQYEIANSGKTVTSSSRQISIATGTTLTLTGTGTTNVVVTQSASALNTALSGFADAYNTVVSELAKQYGQSGGPLQGQSIVYSLSHALSRISTYFSTASGSISMADLGFTLNVDGTLTYSPLSMMGTKLANPAGVAAFLGSTTGGGFLQAATDAINSVVTAGTGLLKTAESSLQSRIGNLGNTIAEKQQAISRLQANLVSQIATADAAIASMQAQYSYMTSVFKAQQTANDLYANR